MLILDISEQIDEDSKMRGGNVNFGFTVALLFLFASVTLAPNSLAQQPGTMRWRAQIAGTSPNGDGLISSPAIANNGTIYVGNYNWPDSPALGTNLYSISPLGTTNWIFSAPGGFSFSPAISPGGIIYISSLNGKFYALNSAGTTNWVFSTPFFDARQLLTYALAADGTIYVNAVAYRVNALYALNPDGTKRWTISLGGVIDAQNQYSAQFPSPAIGQDGTVYIASVDRHLYAITPNGTTNWMFDLKQTTYASPSIGSDGTVYVGTDTNIFYAIDNRGIEKWRFMPGNIVESSAAINSDGNIIFGSVDNFTYAITPGGTQLWKYASGLVSASPALASDGSIYIADRSHVRALDSTGSNTWTFPSPASGQIIFSSPTIGPDGTIYITMDKYLYAIYGSTQLLESPWPMFRRSPDHRGRALQCALSQPGALLDGSFRMTLMTETGLSYRVRASADLSIWTDLTNFVSTNFVMQFVDPDAINFTQRFFRLVTP